MEAAVQFSSALLGVASPASRCSLLVGSKKRSCSAARAPRQRGRRLRARAVEVGAPSGASSAGAPEDEEPPSIDFAFVAVSSSLSLSRHRTARRALANVRRIASGSRGCCRTGRRTCTTGRRAAGRSSGTSCSRTTSTSTGHTYVVSRSLCSSFGGTVPIDSCCF
jgi:hypothetical protein